MLDANTVGDLAHLALSHLDDGRSTTLAGSTLVGAAIGLGTSIARCSAEDKALSGGAHNTPLVVGSCDVDHGCLVAAGAVRRNLGGAIGFAAFDFGHFVTHAALFNTDLTRRNRREGGSTSCSSSLGGSAICLGTERSMLDANTVGDLAHLALSHLDDGRSTTLAGSTLVGAAIGLGTSTARCSAEDKALSGGAHNTPLVVGSCDVDHGCLVAAGAVSRNLGGAIGFAAFDFGHFVPHAALFNPDLPRRNRREGGSTAASSSLGGSAICLGTERSMLDANTVGDLAHLALSHLDDGRSTTLAGSTLVGAAIGLGTSIARCSAEDKALSSGAHNTPLVVGSCDVDHGCLVAAGAVSRNL